jgi:hypothetical protein
VEPRYFSVRDRLLSYWAPFRLTCAFLADHAFVDRSKGIEVVLDIIIIAVT